MHKHAWGRDGEDADKTGEEPPTNYRHFVTTCQLHAVLLQPCGRGSSLTRLRLRSTIFLIAYFQYQD